MFLKQKYRLVILWAISVGICIGTVSYLACTICVRYLGSQRTTRPGSTLSKKHPKMGGYGSEFVSYGGPRTHGLFVVYSMIQILVSRHFVPAYQ